ncbi:MAG: OmpA family protein, partial [Chromatiales bacterium]|nr:OmpA family protein [Chromatiales bacterium]
MSTYTPISIGMSICLLTTAAGISAETDQVTFSGTPDNVQMDYLGDRSRIGVGINSDGDVNGEFLHVFSEDEKAAWLGEGWIGSGGAGGLKLNYHWLSDSTDNVYKAFAAIDQNADQDRKLILGGGIEHENIFFEGYLAHALSDERLINSRSESIEETLSGTDSTGSYQQTQTTTTITNIYESPYDHGVGLRVGRFYDQQLMRVRGGVDYEWGDYSSDQLTFSLGLEKFISGTGHSLALNVEALNRSGDFVDDDDDVRGALTWRYSFGETYRPKHIEKMVQKPVQVTATESQKPRYQIIKNQVDITADTFFDKDSAALRDESKVELKRIADTVAAKELLGKISIVGHTCSLGKESHNMTLSQQRANAVRDQLIAYGVTAEQLLTEGRGETQPRYDNSTEEVRQKNRRVDIHFLAIEETRKALTIEPSPSTEEMRWEKETVTQPAAWRERALVNPVAHKRQVDVYRFEKSTVTTELGEKSYVNQFPIAANDQVQAQRNGGAVLIDVLANDTDPDNDTITISAVTQPVGGSVENFG